MLGVVVPAPPVPIEPGLVVELEPFEFDEPLPPHGPVFEPEWFVPEPIEPDWFVPVPLPIAPELPEPPAPEWPEPIEFELLGLVVPELSEPVEPELPELVVPEPPFIEPPWLPPDDGPLIVLPPLAPDAE